MHANNNLVTLSDGKGNLRHWFFDARNLNTTKVHQGNAADAASSSDFYTQNFDALGRVSIKVDRAGDSNGAQASGTTVTMHYDLAGRLTSQTLGNTLVRLTIEESHWFSLLHLIPITYE